MAKTEIKFMLHLKRRLIMAGIIAAVILLAFFAGLLRGGQQEPGPEITADLLGQQLRQVSDLVTVEYHYTNMGKFENTLNFYGWEVPFTTKSFIVSYDGIIRAGVDLSKTEVTVEETVISIVLPKAEIISNETLEGSLKVYDETHNIFNPISISDYNGFTLDQKQAIESKAIENGLLTAAQERAEELVRSLLGLLPGMEEYEIEIKTGA